MKRVKFLLRNFPPATITPNQLKGFIKKFQEQGIKLDAIVLDYLNLMHSTLGNNSYERRLNMLLSRSEQ